MNSDARQQQEPSVVSRGAPQALPGNFLKKEEDSHPQPPANGASSDAVMSTLKRDDHPSGGAGDVPGGDVAMAGVAGSSSAAAASSSGDENKMSVVASGNGGGGDGGGGGGGSPTMMTDSAQGQQQQQQYVMRPVFLGNLGHDCGADTVERIFERNVIDDGPPIPVERVDLKRGFCFVYLKPAEKEEDKIRAEDFVSAINGREVPGVSKQLRSEFARGDGRIKRKEDDRRKRIQPSETLFVVNFHEQTTKREDLEMLFSPFGEIVRIDLKRNYAFVQFTTTDEARRAKEATNGGKLDQSVITVEFVARRMGDADRRRDRDRDRDRGGGGGGYRDSRGPPPRDGGDDYGRRRDDRRGSYRRDDRHDDYRGGGGGRDRSPPRDRWGYRDRGRSRSRSRSPPGRYRSHRSRSPSPGHGRYRDDYRDSGSRGRSPDREHRDSGGRGRSPDRDYRGDRDRGYRS